jgi:O-antigen/teichoic acid export membrane protein
MGRNIMGRLSRISKRGLSEALRKAGLDGRWDIVRDGSFLFSSGVSGRIVSGAGAFLVAVLYGAEAFAAYSVYLAITAICAAGVTGGFDLAIPSHRAQRGVSGQLAALGLIATVAISTIVTLTFAVAVNFFDGPSVSSLLVDLVPLIFVALLSRGVGRVMTACAVRDSRFQLVAVGNVLLSVALIGGQVALVYTGMPGHVGLALGDAMANAVLAFVLLFRQKAAIGIALRRTVMLTRSFIVLRKWAQLPIYGVPGQLVTMALEQSPVWLLAPFLAPAQLGAMALAMRVCDIPRQLIVLSLSGLAYRETVASSSRARVQTARRFARITNLLAPPLILASVSGVLIFDVLVKGEWDGVSLHALSLAPFYIVMALSGPMYFVYVILSIQRRFFLFQSLIIFMVLSGVCFGQFWFGGYELILCFSISGALGALLVKWDVHMQIPRLESSGK